MNNKSSITGIENFYAVGINYKKSDARLRGRFAISNEQYEAILKEAGNYGVSSLFILSTCNRTEIYGVTNTPNELVNLLCSVTNGEIKEFKGHCYKKEGLGAVEHMFNVAAGLDSQILGDYEIIGQFKQAVRFAKDRGFINTFLEKLYNTVLQASKQIKNQTGLSKGTTSVSFAALQSIKQYHAYATNILIVGAGKMGQRACKNIKDYLGQKVRITLVNRTVDKAERLAEEMDISYGHIADLPILISHADVIIVATASATPVILKSDLEHCSEKLIIDLAIPNNVEPAASELPHIKLVNIDELSLVNSETIQKRQSQVIAAREINNHFINRFVEWCELRKSCIVVNAIKKQLTSICLSQSKSAGCVAGFVSSTDEQRIQQILNGTAGKMKGVNKAGCHYLEALNEFMSPPGLPTNILNPERTLI